MTYNNVFENALLLFFYTSLQDLSGFSLAKSLEQLKEEFKLQLPL